MCNSGVTAEEKFKPLADGTTARYVYYGCTRFHNKQCKNQYLREEDLIEQLLRILDKIDLNMIGVKQKLEKEMERFNEFRNKVLGDTEEDIATRKKTDLRSYVKYLLKDGTMQEKREVMQSFKSKVILINKQVILE